MKFPLKNVPRNSIPEDVACPLGSEYPVASFKAPSKGWILESLTHGRYTHVVSLMKLFKRRENAKDTNTYSPNFLS